MNKERKYGVKEEHTSVWSYQKGFLFEFTDSWYKEFNFFSIRKKRQIETYTNELLTSIFKNDIKLL